MNNPLISVIVPVYNSEKYLHRCIDSILSQTHTDFELLLINDGSTDNSGIICDEYAAKDSRIRVFHKSNGGVSSARNLGLDHAKGKYISFVDSDDETYPNYLSVLFQNINKCDLSYIGILKYDVALQKTGEWTHFEEQIIRIDQTDEELIVKNNLLEVGYPYGKLFHQKIIETYNIRFDERISYQEDLIFTLQYISKCKTVYVSKEYGYIWYVQPNSNSLSHRLLDWNQLILISQILKELYDNLFKRCSIRKSHMDYLQSKYIIGNIRASVYYLYKTQNDETVCKNALRKIIPQLRLSLKRYAYKTKVIKHQIITIFIESYLPLKLKHFILKRIYK